ncbi:MAG: FRG domain-containing protein [Balneolaceae bacterium]|nr:FRG domain-containing protein [Balneolaceae bacterium]MDR9410610.1 FRG domain-containing protein [Balneolaceae bacterium]
MSEQEIPGTGEEEYKSHIDELSDWPTFTITNDRVSGRIPITKIESWKNLPQLLDDAFFKNKQNDFIFRGQRKYSWSLSPTLARVTGDGVVRREIADKLLREFRLKVRGRIHDYTILEDDDELWSVGQHHGLRTPLLDWTKSPYVALFFAFNEIDDQEDYKAEWEDKSNQFRCIYILDKRFVEVEEDMESVRVFEPKMDKHGRLVSQDGLFTISDYETTIEAEILDHVTNKETFQDLNEEDQAEEIAQYICKIYIPNEKREDCLKFLRMMNVHHASLFPDLIGASQHSNHLIEEYATRKEIAEIDKFFEILEAEKIESIMATEDLKEVNKKAYPIDWGSEDDRDQLTSEISKILRKIEVGNNIYKREKGCSEAASDLLQKVIPKLNTDWFKREPLLADIRNTMRSSLLKHSFPISPTDKRLYEIIDLLKSKDELKV